MVFYFRKLRQRDASKFHAQLCIAMFFMLLTFSAGITQTKNEIVCTVVSFLIQYFTLASAFWMGAEAVMMFKKLIIVFGRVTRVFIGVISAICWGVSCVLYFSDFVFRFCFECINKVNKSKRIKKKYCCIVVIINDIIEMFGLFQVFHCCFRLLVLPP